MSPCHHGVPIPSWCSHAIMVSPMVQWHQGMAGRCVPHRETEAQKVCLAQDTRAWQRGWRWPHADHNIPSLPGWGTWVWSSSASPSSSPAPSSQASFCWPASFSFTTSIVPSCTSLIWSTSLLLGCSPATSPGPRSCTAAGCCVMQSLLRVPGLKGESLTLPRRVLPGVGCPWGWGWDGTFSKLRNR